VIRVSYDCAILTVQINTGNPAKLIGRSNSIPQLHRPVYTSCVDRRIPRSVNVLTTSRQFAPSNALRQAEFNPRFRGLMSFSTVHSQEVAGRPHQDRFHSGVGLQNPVMTMGRGRATGSGFGPPSVDLWHLWMVIVQIHDFVMMLGVPKIQV